MMTEALRVQYDRETDTYFVKEKYDGQTYEIGFQLEDSDTTLAANVYIRIYNKRKHSVSNEDNKAITGKHPMHSYVFFKQAFDMLVRKVWRDEMWNSKYDKFIVYVNWTDNRRRDTYYKILKKKGFSYQTLFGKKSIAKIYRKENYNG